MPVLSGAAVVVLPSDFGVDATRYSLGDDLSGDHRVGAGGAGGGCADRCCVWGEVAAEG